MAEAVLVHTEVIGGKILVLIPLVGRAVAEGDPAGVGGIDIAGADVFADDHAVVGVHRASRSIPRFAP